MKGFISYIYLFIFSVNYLAGQDTLIKSGDEWYYHYNEVYPGAGWEERHFPIQNWKIGNTPIGYKYDSVKTTIDLNLYDSLEITTATYYRKNIIIDDPSKYIGYKILYKRDDGAVIYINNKEILRSNMPKGLIKHDTPAYSIIRRLEEGVELVEYLDADNFNPGVNTIGVSMHQIFGSSYDLLFEFELIGIQDEKMLNQYIDGEEEQIENDKFLLLDKKYELNSERIKVEFKDNIIFIQWIIIGVGTFLLGMLAYFFYRYYQRKTEQARIQESEYLTNENRFRSQSQDIINYSIANLSTNALLKEIKLDLIRINHENSPSKTHIATLINRLESQSQSEDDWEQMKMHFNVVFSGFFDRLSQRFPMLTAQELRHCSYIKLHLDTKEIAKILRIDPKSVQASRYRIKRKMDLPENEGLKAFITAL